MSKEALGLIETYGYVAAVEAADACLKSANVTLEKCEFVRGGLVTILITGDVSAVKVAIDAGKMAASRIGKVISSTVIARIGEGLDKTFYEDRKIDDHTDENNNSLTKTQKLDFEKHQMQDKELEKNKELGKKEKLEKSMLNEKASENKSTIDNKKKL
jgi:microcompartment protein CcmL/EutN